MNALRRRCLLAAAALPWALATARAGAADAPPLRLVASFSILADLLRELAPAGSRIHSLIGAEADAHAYSPGPGDARRLADADLLVGVGLGFEPWLERLQAGVAPELPRLDVGEGLPMPASAGAPIGGAGRWAQVVATADPHVWHDPKRVAAIVERIAAALQRLRPAQAAAIDARRRDFLDRLAGVVREARARLAAVPPAARRVVVAHGGYAHLGAAYGLDFVAPLGWRSDGQPSAAVVAGLITRMRAEGIRTVFVDAQRDARLMAQVAEDAGARLGGRLWGDALSRPGGEADSLLRLHAHNTRTLADALLAAPAGASASRRG